MKNIILNYLILLIFQVNFAQIKLDDALNIKTIIFKSTASNSYAPIVKLGEPLLLSFDDLNANEQNYTYKIEHCDYNWEVSSISETEFINGYAEDRILNYDNSFNTLKPYTNYRLTIPNKNTSIKISGNYVLSVINENDDIVFKRPFIVYESNVIVGVTTHRSRDISKIDTQQAVEFIINNPTYRINNPNEEILPVIIQNNNWQTAIKGLKPQFFRGTQLLYKYNKETSFWGGNEFLFFDSKSIRNSTLNIARVELGEDVYNTYLYTNEERIGKPYTLYPDVNGNFVIRNLDSDNAFTDADYSWVYFSLECLENLEGKEVYVQGNYNNWQLNESNKMNYNSDTGLYEAKILLKQGFYNYQYVTKNEKGEISNYDIDGSYFQTENDYTVIVYLNKFGSRYTQVIGVGNGNSEKIGN